DTARFLVGGGAISGTSTVAALAFGGTAQWNVNGGATLATSGGLQVGQGDAGALLINGGAEIISGGPVDIISGGTSGVSSVLVSGSLAKLASAGSLIVGDDGIARLGIELGGTASAGNAIIANTSGASGSSVDVTGVGSTWQVNGVL